MVQRTQLMIRVSLQEQTYRSAVLKLEHTTTYHSIHHHRAASYLMVERMALALTNSLLNLTTDDSIWVGISLKDVN